MLICAEVAFYNFGVVQIVKVCSVVTDGQGVIIIT